MLTQLPTFARADKYSGASALITQPFRFAENALRFQSHRKTAGSAAPLAALHRMRHDRGNGIKAAKSMRQSGGSP
jgi:hypothetical protein